MNLPMIGSESKMKLDSGTTFSYFHPFVHSKIISTISKYCSKNSLRCGGVSQYKTETCISQDRMYYPTLEKFFDSFPTIVFELGIHRAKYYWRPRHYLRISVNAYDSSSRKYCNTIMKAESKFTQVFGAMFMRDYNIFFDREMLLAKFAPADCSSDPPLIDA